MEDFVFFRGKVFAREISIHQESGGRGFTPFSVAFRLKHACDVRNHSCSSPPTCPWQKSAGRELVR